MGVRAYYLAVPPPVAEQAEHDEALWGEISFVEQPHLPSLQLGKGWSTLWYLLDSAARQPGQSRAPSTLGGLAVMGARPFGRTFCERGLTDPPSGLHGYPRALRPVEVVAASDALGTVTPAAFGEPYDPARMEPLVYSLAPADEAWSLFEELRGFYQAASERGDAVVVHVW